MKLSHPFTPKAENKQYCADCGEHKNKKDVHTAVYRVSEFYAVIEIGLDDVPAAIRNGGFSRLPVDDDERRELDRAARGSIRKLLDAGLEKDLIRRVHWDGTFTGGVIVSGDTS